MRKIDATIVIPVKNGGNVLKILLNKIFSQKTTLEYEIIVVDSGSKDNSLEIIKKYPKIKLYEIKPEEFNHGLTRNFGASKGTGEFIVFLTQDAIPASDFWLDNLVSSCKLKENIAGAFGKHLPYPDCNILDKRDLFFHFENFGKCTTFQKMEDKEKYKNDIVYVQWLSFFSDNNSCLKRKVWEKIPYDNVTFAEDQIWAKKIIELGYTKVYAPYAPVYHSHNYELKEYGKRYYDNFKGVYNVYNHGYIHKKYLVYLYTLNSYLSDKKYIKTLNLEKKEEKKWKKYSLIRNYYKYLGAYLATKYVMSDEKTKKELDKKYSQQKKQRES